MVKHTIRVHQIELSGRGWYVLNHFDFILRQAAEIHHLRAGVSPLQGPLPSLVAQQDPQKPHDLTGLVLTDDDVV